ncbi:hypothetical protein D9M71_832160 [compost metagenome]
MIVTTSSNTRVSSKVGELTRIGSLQHLNKSAPSIAVLGHLVGKIISRQVAYISRVKRPNQPGPDPLAY